MGKASTKPVITTGPAVPCMQYLSVFLLSLLITRAEIAPLSEEVKKQKCEIIICTK
jgi:hypothetical protein